MLGRLGQDLAAFALDLAACVARLHAGFQRHAVGMRTGGVAPGMPQRSAAELEAGVVAEDRG